MADHPPINQQYIIFGAVAFFTLVLMLKGMLKSGKSPLLDAATKGDGRRIAGLLKNGADVNKPNGMGTTALMLAAQNGHRAVVEYLLTKGANPNAFEGETSIESEGKFTKSGMTALMYAAQAGHVEIVKSLVGKGADIASRNKMGQNAMMLAAHKGKAGVVQALIDAGGDVHAKDSGGLKAWNWAQQGRDPETLALLKKITLKDIL
jgi:ankyrin repeat protein